MSQYTEHLSEEAVCIARKEVKWLSRDKCHEWHLPYKPAQNTVPVIYQNDLLCQQQKDPAIGKVIEITDEDHYTNPLGKFSRK